MVIELDTTDKLWVVDAIIFFVIIIFHELGIPLNQGVSRDAGGFGTLLCWSLGKENGYK